MKPGPKQHFQFDNCGNGCGTGCWSIGCLGVIGLIITLCIVGYYSVFHSSLPLRILEAAIEEDGEVEIEGLTGTLSNGFSADELRFKTTGDQWSNLTDIKFKYESNTSLLGTDRMIIREMSVDGGTIYADWDPDQNEFDFDQDIREDIEEIDDELAELDDGFRDEIGRSFGIREFRIDLISVANLKIVNPATQLEITIDEIKFEGFKWHEGDLQNLGKLLVQSSQLDLRTVPSVEFAEMKNAERFEGTLRSEADHRLKVDVPFVVDFCVNDELDLSVKSELFDGQLQIVQLPDESTLHYLDFSPADFIDLKTDSVLPSKINMKLGFGENWEEGPTHVNADGSLELGKTRFRDLRIQQHQGGPSHIMADANVNGETVFVSIIIDGPYSPWRKVRLETESCDTLDELWAQTLFGRAYDQLSEDQQAAVRASIPNQKALAENDADQAGPEGPLFGHTHERHSH